VPRHWVAMLFAILAAPALAQTDDRVLNDVVTVLAGLASVGEMANQCARATADDPEIAAAFETFRDRSVPWQVIAVTLIGTRGGLDAEMLAAERDAERQKIADAFAGDPDPTRGCRDFARSVIDRDADIAKLYPAETRRMSEARSGKWPVLDVARSAEVADALAMKQFFFMRETLLARCATLTGDSKLYRDARSYWNQQNYDAFYYAHQILTNWGALAPQHLEAAQQAAASEAEAELATSGVARCEKFVAGLEAGNEDVERLVPELYDRVRTAAEIEP
jgi:hypothetical protein